MHNACILCNCSVINGEFGTTPSPSVACQAPPSITARYIYWPSVICVVGNQYLLFFPTWKHRFPGENEGAGQLGLLGHTRKLNVAEIWDWVW